MAELKQLLTIFIVGFILSASNSRSEAISTGPVESPWTWVSNSGDADPTKENLEVVEVVDVLDTDSFSSRVGQKSEPKLIGRLKRKLCRVGLGIGKRSPICFQSINSSNRVKRSAKPDDDDKKGRATTSSRFFGNGLDGLLNPHISPSFGVHFGQPYGYGGYGGYGGYHRGYDNPFAFNLGPISINPFGGLRVSFRDGRPLIRPTLDFHVTPNVHHNNYYPQPYDNYNYHNRYTREAKHPLTNDQPTAFVPSAPISHKIRSPKPASPALPVYNPVYSKYPKRHQVHYSPVNKQVAYSGGNEVTPSQTIFHEHEHKHSLPYLGLGKSLSSSGAVKDDRDNVFQKNSS